MKIKLILSICFITVAYAYAACPNKGGLTPAIGSSACQAVEHDSWFLAPIPLSSANCDQPITGSQCSLVDATVTPNIYLFAGSGCLTDYCIGVRSSGQEITYKVPNVSSCKDDESNPGD